MKTTPRTTRASIAAALLLLLAPALYAKPSSVTLAELVHKSSVIVLGRVETNGKSVPKPGSGRVSFKSLRVLKGEALLVGRDIQLCNSPPPMAEYPDLSKFTGEAVLLLSSEEAGCFEYSHTTTSFVMVDHGTVTSAAIADEPIYQPWDVFLKKLRKLVAKHGT
jgi:hypothetical protein